MPRLDQALIRSTPISPESDWPPRTAHRAACAQRRIDAFGISATIAAQRCRAHLRHRLGATFAVTEITPRAPLSIA
jgi:hypothetical protein